MWSTVREELVVGVEVEEGGRGGELLEDVVGVADRREPLRLRLRLRLHLHSVLCHSVVSGPILTLDGFKGSRARVPWLSRRPSVVLARYTSLQPL